MINFIYPEGNITLRVKPFQVKNMAKAFVPRVNYKDIDLSMWGGEGTLRLNAMSGETSAILSTELIKRGEKEGFTIEQIRENPEKFDAMFNVPMAMISIQLCAEIEEDGVWRKLTEEEVKYLPTNFLSYLFEELQGLNDFPLAQTAGAESK